MTKCALPFALLAARFATALEQGSAQCLAEDGECRAPEASPPSTEHLLLQLGKVSVGEHLAKAEAVVPVSAFFWNVHWECSMGARGASKTCKHEIGSRFRELAAAAGAEIVASVELEDSPHKPASFAQFGFHRWTQVDGPCRRGWNNGDAAALAFAPGWRVQKSSGGCLRKDYDIRAFAVALVVPPKPVKGCPRLCVVAIHAPHQAIDDGKDTVQDVCGAAVERCTIAMGDWNVPAEQVGRLWEQAIGGSTPQEAHPNERTCCYPESHHYGVFDHIATNIDGAIHANQTVHPYQLTHLNPVKQHKAVAARLLLPAA